MALPLTVQQAQFVSEFEANADAFVLALKQAFKADNDPDHALGDASLRRDVFEATLEAMLRNVGAPPELALWWGVFSLDDGTQVTRTSSSGPYDSRVAFRPLGSSIPRT